MFGLSGEHLLILAGVLLIFGPRKLPELGASIGRALRNFKEGLNTPTTTGKLEAHDPNPVETKSAPEAMAVSQKPTTTSHSIHETSAPPPPA